MRNGLPQGWLFHRLGDIVTPRKGKKPAVSKNFSMKGFVPYLNIQAVEKGEIVTYAEARSSRLATPEDLFVVWDGARSGWVGLGREGAIGSTIMALKPSMGDRYYLYRWLQNQFNYINSNTRGTGIPHVDPEIFWDLKIPFAPLPEQRRIVAKLEKILGKVQDSQKRLAKIPVLLKRFRQSVLAAACSGRLTADWREKNKIDYDWPIEKLGEFGSVTGGITKNAKRQTMKLQVPYLRVANVYENRLELDEVFQIGVTEQEFERASLRKGDLLFVEGNGSLDQIGRVALWDGSITRCVHQNHLIKFRAGEKVSPDYVLLQMMAPESRSQLIEKSISSAGLNTLSISKISDVNFPVPLPDEQNEIVRRVTVLFTLADQIETRYKKAQAQVDKLTQSILAKAFRGELVPQDPNDEPASVLIKKIQDRKGRRSAG